jgi:predicted restriction endonuclease
MAWIDEIIKAYEFLGGIAPYSKVYKFIKENTSRNLPSSWKAIIRKIVEDHSSDSKNFKGKDLFYSVDGLGKGVWGLRSKIKDTPKAEDLGIVEEETKLPEKTKTEIFRVLRDTKLTRELKVLYDNKCQICGKKIRLKECDYSEAHHIKPLEKHLGPDSSDNIIVLCPNHHVEFDYGVLAINPKTLEIIHQNKNSEFVNKKIILNPIHKLNEEYLEYHLNEIFNNGKEK